MTSIGEDAFGHKPGFVEDGRSLEMAGVGGDGGDEEAHRYSKLRLEVNNQFLCCRRVWRRVLCRRPQPGVLPSQVYYLENETFSPGNQGFRLRFNRAIWMASPIHWSVERLRDL